MTWQLESYLREIKMFLHKKTGVRMLIEALFMMVNWKQTRERINKLWSINRILFSNIRE